MSRRRATSTAVWLSVAAAAALSVVPTMDSVQTSVGTEQPTQITVSGHSTVLAAAGWAGLAILAWPVAISLGAFVLDRQGTRPGAWFVAAALVMPVLPFGFFMIGGWFMPSVIAMIVAGRNGKRTLERDASLTGGHNNLAVES